MIREMELLFQASRTSPMPHKAAVTVEAGVAALRNERDELVLQNERLGNDFVAAEARCARLQQALVAMVYVHPCNCGDGIPQGACARCRAVKELGFDPALAGPSVSEAEPDTPADSPVSDETVVQLRASGWSEEKISASMIRAQERKQRRLTYPPPADSQEDNT